MSTWSELSIKDRAALIQMMANEGMSSLDEMEEYYNGITQKTSPDEEESEYQEEEYQEELPQEGYSSLPSGGIPNGRQYYIKPDGSIGVKQPNTFAFGGDTLSDNSKRQLINRAKQSPANWVRRLQDKYRKAISNPDGSISTHRLGYVTNDNTAVVFPEISGTQGLLYYPVNPVETAIQNRDTVEMSIPEAEWFTQNYKDYFPDFNYNGVEKNQEEFAKGGRIHIKPSKKGTFTAAAKKQGKSVQAFASQVLAHKENYSPAMIKKANFARNASKWHSEGGSLNLAPFAMGGPINPNNYLPSFIGRRQPLPAVRFDEGGFTIPNWNMEETQPYVENKYDRISNARYQTAFDTLSNRGYNRIDADRLASILAAQSINETGWLDSDKNNNYAGYLFKGKKINFGSPEEFWEYHIDNLNNRWPGWDKANNLDEYFSIINHTDLGLTTEAAYNAYMKNHKNNPIYIYAPDWQNTNYLGKMKSISSKMNKYIQPKGPLFGK